MNKFVNSDREFIEIDFDKKIVKGYCKKKTFSQQIQELKKVIGDIDVPL